jgi:hypothetical protein
VNSLSQWAALNVLAQTADGSRFAEILDVPASWWVDGNGTAHGVAEHAATPEGLIPDPVTGTLRDLATATRHAKSCCSVAKAGGDAGVAAATIAQQLTEGTSSLEALEKLVKTSPHSAVVRADGDIKRISAHCASLESGSDARTLYESILASLTELREIAWEQARSDQARASVVETYLQSAAHWSPQSPLVQLEDLTHTAGLWRLAYSAAPKALDQAWMSSVRETLLTSKPVSTAVLEHLDADAVADRLKGGASVTDAVNETWRAHALGLLDAIPAFTADTCRLLSADTRTYVVITTPEVWKNRHPDILTAWARDRDLEAGVVEVPAPVAQYLTALRARVTASPLDEPLDDQAWVTLNVLARDAGWEVEDVQALVTTARALAN